MNGIAHRYAYCALAFPLCLTLQASTMATVTADAFYSAPGISYSFPCSQTSQSDPASASCVLNSSAYPQVDYRASATVADGEISATVGGGAVAVNSRADTDALAGFTDSFTFTPDNGQNAPAAVQYVLVQGVYSSSSDAQSTATFNGVPIGSCFLNAGCEQFFPVTITQPYSGGTFESSGQVTASFQFQNGEDGGAAAGLWVESITMLDARGQPVAGTLVPAPEPAFWPSIGLLSLGLGLFAKRQNRTPL
ncbi:MAG TPA: hypothetical protein VKV15_00585 [Bryobacteraceae bacterium]|nr:hypothetical protein [Bryobacteraceae bacterium]